MMPTMKRPAAACKRGIPASKRPAAAVAGPQVESVSWATFCVVPTSIPKNNQPSLDHLVLPDSMNKPPALVKHIQNGTLHTSTGCQSVKDFLRSVEKKGDVSWIKAYDGGDQTTKRAVLERLKFVLDEKSLLCVKHSITAGKQTRSREIRGWMSLWEVADVEKIPFDPKYTAVLQSLVSDDDSRPHSKPQLAATGWREYFHVKSKAEVADVLTTEQFVATARPTDMDMADFEMAKRAITAVGGSSSIEGDQGSTCAEPDTPWTRDAKDVIKRLSDAENQATTLAMQIEDHIKKGSKHLTKKHGMTARSWASKLSTKKGHIIKLSTLVRTVDPSVVSAPGNKFDKGLREATELIDEWGTVDGKVMLQRLVAN